MVTLLLQQDRDKRRLKCSERDQKWSAIYRHSPFDSRATGTLERGINLDVSLRHLRNHKERLSLAAQRAVISGVLWSEDI